MNFRVNDNDPQNMSFAENYRGKIDAQDRNLLLSELRKLSWQPITESDLPKAGDEVGAWHNIPENPPSFEVQEVEDYVILGDDDVPIEGMTKEFWDELEWTHFRPINPPDKP